MSAAFDVDVGVIGAGIHGGGLRYLETGQFRLVRESLLVPDRAQRRVLERTGQLPLHAG